VKVRRESKWNKEYYYWTFHWWKLLLL